jgi:hypothetical protein
MYRRFAKHVQDEEMRDRLLEIADYSRREIERSRPKASAFHPLRTSERTLVNY